LAENPPPPGFKKLMGYRNYWRIRVGDWRIVYTIDDGEHVVTVMRIAHRREVYG
jgi:mRNA interferase RelE/StbE